MTISEIMEKMIRFSDGSLHDISHLIAVWTYARTIGELEHLDPETQFILEVAAITHDIDENRGREKNRGRGISHIRSFPESLPCCCSHPRHA